MDKEYLLSHELIDWEAGFNPTTGEQIVLTDSSGKPWYQGRYKQVTFKIFDDSYKVNKKIIFSPEKYFRAGVYHYNPITELDFRSLIKELFNKFNLDPYKTYVKNLDVRCDIRLDSFWKVNTILEHPFFHFSQHGKYRGSDLSRFKNGGIQRKVVRDTFELKEYNKSYDICDKGGNILRLECKTKVMRDLNNNLKLPKKHKLSVVEVYNYWYKIKEYKRKKLKQCFFFDYRLCDHDPALYKKYSNAMFWDNLTGDSKKPADMKKYHKAVKRELSNYKSICDKYGLQLNNWINWAIDNNI